MKRLVVFFFLVSSCLLIQARITVMCDVIYEKSLGEWSDYYRTDVDFMYGSEINDSQFDSNKLYAVIWFSQTECAIIEQEYRCVSLGSVDKGFIFIFLTSDVLNEGRLGYQVNDRNKRKWRIYGKDDYSFLIDPMFLMGSYNSYNERVKANQNNGLVTRRQRPKEETQYNGLIKGVVQYVSPNEWYIIKTNQYYVGVERNKSYMFYGSINIGDVVFADFHSKGNTSISNATKNTTHHHVIVRCHFKGYQDCYNWMKEQLEKPISQNNSFNWKYYSDGGFSYPSNYKHYEKYVDDVPASVDVFTNGNIYMCYWPLLGFWSTYTNYPFEGVWLSPTEQVKSVTYRAKNKGIASGYTNRGNIYYLKQKIMHGGQVDHSKVLVLIHSPSDKNRVSSITNIIANW